MVEQHLRDGSDESPNILFYVCNNNKKVIYTPCSRVLLYKKWFSGVLITCTCLHAYYDVHFQFKIAWVVSKCQFTLIHAKINLLLNVVHTSFTMH